MILAMEEVGSTLGKIKARSSVGVDTAELNVEPRAEPGELNDGAGEGRGARVSLLGGIGGDTCDRVLYGFKTLGDMYCGTNTPLYRAASEIPTGT